MENRMLEAKKVIYGNATEIECLQLAIISGISSVLYSEFISNMKSKEYPSHVVLTPEIKLIKNILNDYVITEFSKLLENLPSNENLSMYKLTLPELNILSNKNSRSVIAEYISRNVLKTIPNMISHKFGFEQFNNQIREDRSIMMFENNRLKLNMCKFISDQVILNLLVLSPNVKKHIDEINIRSDQIADYPQIISICNDKAISPLYINGKLLNNPLCEEGMELIKFVSGMVINNQSESYKYGFRFRNHANDVSIITLSTRR